MINILVTDDHPIVRNGLKLILSDEPDMKVVCEASNGLDALAKLKANKVDVVILDISMPGMSGLEVLVQIRNLYPELPVLMLSVLSEEVFAAKTLKAGASGFIHKESIPEELVRAVRKVAAGGLYISSYLAEKLAGDMKAPVTKVLHENLSFREFQIMCMIAAGKTLTEIGESLCISVKTVSTYRARLLEKMNLKNNSELTSYCMKEGLVE
ncbi:MAG TPA: response regulator transcription factor [Bacteroidales bacterium]|nr:response regulator transcription factor [Bacteroidales bacterium]